MSDAIDVRCKHLEGELMRIQFANSQIVSDHPAEWGGTDTGPAPGDMIAMALTAATALAGRQFADANGFAVSHIGARASMTSLQEGLPRELGHVPLPHLTYVEKFWRLLEIDGALTTGQRGDLIEAMTDNPIAQVIRNGIEISEKVIFHESSLGTAQPVAAQNELLKGRPSLPEGEIRTGSPAVSWRVSAAAMDGRTCLVKAANSIYVLSDDTSLRQGPTPCELLAGGLAACTTIYIARNAAFLGISLDAVTVSVRCRSRADRNQPITGLEKVAEITGALSDDERQKLRAMAEYCAFGITLSRGAGIEDCLSVRSSAEAENQPSSAAMLERDAPVPNDPSYCADGSCCIPVMEAQPS